MTTDQLEFNPEALTSQSKTLDAMVEPAEDTAADLRDLVGYGVVLQVAGLPQEADKVVTHAAALAATLRDVRTSIINADRYGYEAAPSSVVFSRLAGLLYGSSVADLPPGEREDWMVKYAAFVPYFDDGRDRSPEDNAAILERLPADLQALWWNNMSEDEQDALIEQRPDVVLTVGPYVELTDAQCEALEHQLGVGEKEVTVTAGVGVAVPIPGAPEVSAKSDTEVQFTYKEGADGAIEVSTSSSFTRGLKFGTKPPYADLANKVVGGLTWQFDSLDEAMSFVGRATQSVLANQPVSGTVLRGAARAAGYLFPGSSTVDKARSYLDDAEPLDELLVEYLGYLKFAEVSLGGVGGVSAGTSIPSSQTGGIGVPMPSVRLEGEQNAVMVIDLQGEGDGYVAHEVGGSFKVTGAGLAGWLPQDVVTDILPDGALSGASIPDEVTLELSTSVVSDFDGASELVITGAFEAERTTGRPPVNSQKGERYDIEVTVELTEENREAVQKAVDSAQENSNPLLPLADLVAMPEVTVTRSDTETDKAGLNVDVAKVGGEIKTTTATDVWHKPSGSSDFYSDDEVDAVTGECTPAVP